MQDSKSIIEQAMEARSTVEFASRICTSLQIPDKPEAIAAQAMSKPQRPTRFLTREERQHLIVAVWRNDPTGFYLALANAIPEREAPEPEKQLPDEPSSINRRIAHDSHQNTLMNGRWTYLRNRQHIPGCERRLSAALATWGTTIIEEFTDQSEQNRQLAVAAVRTAFEPSKILTKPPFAARPAGRRTRSGIRFPDPRKPKPAIRNLHRRASQLLIKEYIIRDILCNERRSQPSINRFSEVDVSSYAAVVTDLGEKHTHPWLRKRIFSPEFFNATLNMYAQHFPDQAAKAELIYRATGGNLPLLIPGATVARRAWLEAPRRGARAAHPLQPMTDTVVRRYHDKPFMEQAHIFFQCWLRALSDDGIAKRDLPNVFTSYIWIPDEIILRAPGYWPGPYHRENPRYAIIRVNIPTLISQCMHAAASRCRP